jgi:hypothetical protein
MQYQYHTSEVRRRVYICCKMLNDYLGMLHDALKFQYIVNNAAKLPWDSYEIKVG